ncbi:hypothetical protein DMUE_6215 [Dictyocoela muelleri]|nr:hypothetical protein DMUE_6215 [Dictyocoela muelleri]
MNELINICDEKGILERSLFILDNARNYHTSITWFFLLRNLNVMFLSPYSYMLNPIEFSFSKVKSIVRRNLANGFDRSFTYLILNSVQQLTREDLENYYRHAYNNCIKAVSREDFN